MADAHLEALRSSVARLHDLVAGLSEDELAQLACLLRRFLVTLGRVPQRP